MRNMKIVFVGLIVLLMVLYISNFIKLVFNRESVRNVANSNSYDYIREKLNGKDDKIIIIDPGHGGKDPGKVGVNDCLEKDINLDIAFKLKDKLIKSGFGVIMTRTKDVGLYSELDINKKNADLRNRVNLINESDAIAVISIHQNAYTSTEEKGAQVFYHTKSESAFDLAKCIQESLKKYHDVQNKRREKNNTSYYMLKKTERPTVIVECGFLSNVEEANKLINDSYQDSVAEAINNGVIIWANNILESVY